ncbi:hypothetical protein BU24DRAFT_28039, partial [Aaosphaeria arxii CBS 175.79]
PSETFRIANDPTPSSGQCVRIYDVPDILRLRAALPHRDGGFQVHGDVMTPLACPIPTPEDDGDVDDPEDVRDTLSPLPVVQVDAARHFTMKAKYMSEVTNLLQCQRASPRAIQLLGRSASGELVFERHLTRYDVGRYCSIAIYKRWILDIIDALACLHGRGSFIRI